MKAWSRVLAALALSISLILSSLPRGSRAAARPIAKWDSSFSSASKTISSSKANKDLQTNKRTNYKQLGPSFRNIPPSTSNPTQNKFKPP